MIFHCSNTFECSVISLDVLEYLQNSFSFFNILLFFGDNIVIGTLLNFSVDISTIMVQLSNKIPFFALMCHLVFNKWHTPV